MCRLVHTNSCHVRALLIAAIFWWPSVGQSQVISPPTNITASGLGTKINGSATLGCTGGTCDITGGSRRGTNLFHSFGFFDVGTGDTANFFNDTGLTTSNIVGRVNGGQTSSIFGTIKTTGFDSANLFLINPFGWIFGPGAFLDVGGSFHVSTANYLKFADGTFSVDNSPLPASGLTTNPVAFGFLGVNPPASITVNGTVLNVPNGQTLSLVGGDIQVTGSTLAAPGGRVQIASVASGGEVTIPDLGVSSFSSLGQINISANNDGVPSVLDVSADAAGTVEIRGGRLFVSGGSVILANTGEENGAPLAVDLQITNEITLDSGSAVVVLGVGAGDTGNIRIESDHLQMQGFSAVIALGLGTGGVGGIDIDVGSLTLTDGATVLSQTFGGAAGDVKVKADDSILISGGASVSSQTFSSVGTGADVSISARSLTVAEAARVESISGDAAAGGNINVAVENLTLSGGSVLNSDTVLAFGGDISVTASKSAVISGSGSGIGSRGSSSVGDAPSAGSIELNVGQLTVTQEGAIQTGDPISSGGSISISAQDSIVISDRARILSQAFIPDVGNVVISAPTGILKIDNGLIQTSTTEAGRAGDVLATVAKLTMTNGGQIVTSSASSAPGTGGDITVTANSVSISGRSSSGPVSSANNDVRSGLFSNAQGSGPGGNIGINAAQVLLAKGGVISASSTGTVEALAGNVNIITDNLSMDNATITTEALVADGGNISITTNGSLLHMTNSQITSSVGEGRIGEGAGGDITIGSELHPFDFIVLDNSGIHANAFGGPGGNINIFTDVLLSSLPITSAITASSERNTPGTIDIQATVTQFTSDVSQLPEAPLQATELLRATCAARVAAGRSSSLVLAGRGGLPLEPGGLLPSPLYLGADSAISFDKNNSPDERLTLSPSNFSILSSDNKRLSLPAGWNQFQLAKTALGLDCAQ